MKERSSRPRGRCLYGCLDTGTWTWVAVGLLATQASPATRVAERYASARGRPRLPTASVRVPNQRKTMSMNAPTLAPAALGYPEGTKLATVTSNGRRKCHFTLPDDYAQHPLADL